MSWWDTIRQLAGGQAQPGSPQPEARTAAQPITLDDRMQQVFGMDPNAQRTNFVPAPKQDEQGNVTDWSDWTAPQAVYDLLKAMITPGHVAQGGQWDEGDATNMALNMAGAGSAVGRAPKGSAGMFAGVNSKTADMQKLHKALDMAAEHQKPGTIIDETGWFQGPDKLWRYEIPDDKAMFSSYLPEQDMKRPRRDPYDTVGRANLEEVLYHPELYRAYPELRKSQWQLVPQSQMPGYNGQQAGDVLKIASSVASHPQQGKSVTLHEAQHLIQDLEGFARGGNSQVAAQMPYLYDSKLKTLLENVERAAQKDPGRLGELHRLINSRERVASGWDANDYYQLKMRTPEYLQYQNEVKNLWQRMSPEEMYRNLAGEVEARNAQTRMKYDDYQRKAIDPWFSADVPASKQIVHFGDGVFLNDPRSVLRALSGSQ